LSFLEPPPPPPDEEDDRFPVEPFPVKVALAMIFPPPDLIADY